MMLLTKQLTFSAVTTILLLVSTIHDVAGVRVGPIDNVNNKQIVPTSYGWDSGRKSFFRYAVGQPNAFNEDGLVLKGPIGIGLGAYGTLKDARVEVHCATIKEHNMLPYSFYIKCMNAKYNTPEGYEAKSIINCPIRRYQLSLDTYCYLVSDYGVHEHPYIVADRYRDLSLKSRDPKLTQAYIQNFVNKLKKGFQLLKELGWYYYMDSSTVTIIGEHEIKFVKSSGFLNVRSVGFFGNSAYKAQTQKFDKTVTELVTGFYMRFGYSEAQTKPMLPTVLKGLLINSR
ncbi:hypothetical protein BDF19DRAFT_414811 [Syncephalis fuscata]|nr:hypothetical protein BDF19DRAFT_414811 [Syncephalis fuscata]